MNEQDRELLDGLRALAADGPREAPAHIQQRLLVEFRKRNRSRHLREWAPTAGLAAAVGIVLLVWAHNAKPTSPDAIAAVVSSQYASPVEDSEASFYPLPEAEALPAVENAMVVRVQLPVSSLRLMGVPVGEERGDASVQADLLLGQDGLARGVRLVQ